MPLITPKYSAMKNRFLIVFVFATVLQFTSCKKCVDCTPTGSIYPSSSNRHCKPDYYDNRAWQDLIKAYESMGNTCK
jgi:hypothetical protein